MRVSAANIFHAFKIQWLRSLTYMEEVHSSNLTEVNRIWNP